MGILAAFWLMSWGRVRKVVERVRKVGLTRHGKGSVKGWKLMMGGMIGKLLTLLRAFPSNEPTKKRFVSEMIAWSGKAGEYPNGDPELHHVAGTVSAEGG